MSGPTAAVDVGTNSVRLLVLDGQQRPLARKLEITRLGQGVDATGRLDDEALRRTLETIGRYRRIWNDLGADGRVRIAATSAVRDAANRDAFFDGVRDRAGVAAEVLTGDQEAGMAFLGVAHGLPDLARPVVVLDIGGGSTELVVGSDAAEASISLQLGSVRLTERILVSDPHLPAEVETATTEIDAQLDRADDALAEQGVAATDAATLVGVAGTVTTVAALNQGLDTYVEGAVHGTELGAADARRWAQRLCGLTVDEKRRYGAIQAGREDVIAAGSLILARVIERYGFGSLVVSEADILDGLALSADHRA